jgi:hypothetical protein
MGMTATQTSLDEYAHLVGADLLEELGAAWRYHQENADRLRRLLAREIADAREVGIPDDMTAATAGMPIDMLRQVAR